MNRILLILIIAVVAGCTTDCDDGYMWTPQGEAITDDQGRILKCD